MLEGVKKLNLTKVPTEKEYTIKEINSNDENLKSFLFTLGCYEGQKITVLSRRKSGCIVAIKDARYSIDKDLASSITV